MNPPLRNPLDAAKYREQYINNLLLQASNNQMNLNANLIYKNTEQTPSQPTDYRTATEKFADIDGMRREVRSFLAASKLVNSTNANIVAQDLNEDELSFVIQYKAFIEKDFKGRDVPAEVLINYLDSLRFKTAQTNGVDYGLQQSSGGNILLSMNQIKWDMVTKLDLDRLINVIQDMNNNANLQRSAEASIRELRNLLPSESVMSSINKTSLWQQYDAMEIVNDALESVPSQSVFQSTMQDAELAMQDPSLQANFLREVINEYQPSPEFQDTLQELDTYVKMSISNESPMERQELSPTTSAFGSPLAPASIDNPYAQLFDRLAPDNSQSPEAFKRIHGNTSVTDRPPMKRTVPTSPNLNLAHEFESEPVIPVFSKEDKINRMNHYLSEDPERFLSSNGTQYRNVPSNTHHNTANALHRDYQRKSVNDTVNALQKGHGLPYGRMRGKGLSKREKIQHRIEGEFQKPKPYKQLGRYLINRDKLADDIVMLKRVGGSKVPEFPSQRVPHNVAKALTFILRQTVPESSEMSSAEIKTLQAILKICRCSNITISNPHKKTDEEKEMDRFNILSGEIQAGNDNKALVKEFKLMIVKFMNAGRIPRRQAQEILVDIASMGL